MPFPISSSATYCTIDFRAIGSISFGCDLVAGRSLVPCPATGTIALRITITEYIERRREAALELRMPRQCVVLPPKVSSYRLQALRENTKFHSQRPEEALFGRQRERRSARYGR